MERTTGRRAVAPPGLPTQMKPANEAVGLFEGVRYEEYWADPSQTRQDTLEQYLLGRLLPSRGRRIIDLGCGYGRLTPLYLDRFDQVVLLDGSLSLLNAARARYGDRVLAVAGDVRSVPFRDDSFDCALSVRVLQHLHEPAPALREAHRLLAGGASYVASFHNKRNARRVLHYFTGRAIPSPFSPDSVEVSPALVSHDPRRFDTWLREAGFESHGYQGAMVFGPVAKLADTLPGGTPSGAWWASVTGALRIAPWLIGTARTDKPETIADTQDATDLLCCPHCRAGLERTDTAFRCLECDRTFPVTEGILDFRM